MKLILPYAIWMVMMALLPSTAFWYAIRGVVTALALALVGQVEGWRLEVEERLKVEGGRLNGGMLNSVSEIKQSNNLKSNNFFVSLRSLLRKKQSVKFVKSVVKLLTPTFFVSLRSLLLKNTNLSSTFNLQPLFIGFLAGLAVFAIWIAPEELFGLGKQVLAADSPYSPEVCGWPLTIAKLLASGLVISVAEELFFRKWLVEFAGFWWMVVLFAVEHGDRWAVGAITGIVYGLLAKRFGLSSSIVAHATTNLVLGLWVIFRGAWQFW